MRHKGCSSIYNQHEWVGSSANAMSEGVPEAAVPTSAGQVYLCLSLAAFKALIYVIIVGRFVPY